MNKFLFFIVVSFYGSIMTGQETVITFDLQALTPSYSIIEKKTVQINIITSPTKNLIKHYDANPFEKPVIVPKDNLQGSITGSLEQYLSKVGIHSSESGTNQITLKVVICAINYLSGKGWTATVKFNIEALSKNEVVLYHTLSGYQIEPGNENEPMLAEKAINRALFEAFEKVNWELLATKLANQGNTSGPPPELTLQAPVEQPHSNDEITTVKPVPNSKPFGSNLNHSLGKYYALLIAIDDYQFINKLDQPIGDAIRLQQILTTSYSFSPERIFFLKNPTRAEIIDQLDRLVSLISEKDNLLLFYAGHGYWDEYRQTGYWLPVDATQSSTANWLRNSTIQEYIGDINSKHTLLIADACFGGGIFKTRKAFHDAGAAINHVYELPSRKAITSGMLNEVPDKSVFFEYMIRRLQMNSEKYLTALQLFTSFRIAVANNSNNVPQYGTIQKTGDEGGDFVFVKESE